MVPPKGESFARFGSTWIHWKSSVALAKRSMRSCGISTQGETPTSWPTFDPRSRSLIAVLAMPLPDEFFHFAAHQLRLLVHDPVRGLRHAHQLQDRHKALQPAEQPDQQRRVPL